MKPAIQTHTYLMLCSCLPLQRHPEGVMAVNFKEFESADQCVQALNGRWFAKKRISAEAWDGKTKYEIEESTAERDERLKKWSDFLEADEKKRDEKKEETSNPAPSASVGASSSEKAALTESSASSVSSASASGSSARDGAPDMDTDRSSDGSGCAQPESAAAGEAH